MIDSKIKKILENIDALHDSLQKEYDRMAKQYGFSINERRVIFLKKFNDRNRSLRIPTWRYAVPRNIRHFLSIPFIYIMIIPVVILDFFLMLYNTTALPLYHIPKVARKDHFIFDRQFLAYLNMIQKINCVYCSYVNGLFSYASEIGARTERYWCPIKAAHRPKHYHTWYKDFADYGNPEQWNTKFNQANCFLAESEKKLQIKNN
ncbi:MAG: hypothetical protein QG603_693 [Patescibacteria group bacterium]|nr:hypothetical protein [Patescibacteria group bacterium]